VYSMRLYVNEIFSHEALCLVISSHILITSVAECLFGDKTDILLEWAAADNEGTETRVHSC
jgi:hypothetical protein